MSAKFASRADMLESIKTDANNDSEMIQKRKRFGLFSFKTPNAICDSMLDRKFPKRDGNGKIVISPRNVQTTCVKNGKGKTSYFSTPAYITIGNPYVDPDRQNRLYELEKKMMIPKDLPIFKPQNLSKEIHGKAPYEHHTNLKDDKRISRVNSENKVMISPSNVLTGPYRYTIKYQHLNDEYSRELDKQRRESAEHRFKIKDKAPFRTWDVGSKNFASHRQTFQIPDNLKEQEMQIFQKVKQANLQIMAHEMAFKPSSPAKIGYNKTLNPFPKYTENPPKKVVRRFASEDQVKKDPFKLNHPLVLAAPSPTVTCNLMNLRKEIGRQSSGVSFKNN